MKKYPITSFVNSKIFAYLTAPIFLYRSLAVHVPFLCRMACCTYGQLKCLIPASLSSCPGTGHDAGVPHCPCFLYSVFPAFTQIYVYFSLLAFLVLFGFFPFFCLFSFVSNANVYGYILKVLLRGLRSWLCVAGA